MRALIQRVSEAQVIVKGEVVGQIGKGILTFLGVGRDDDEVSLEKLIQKIFKLRVFEDPHGKMNLSLQDIKGEHLIVSQFTLYGDTQKGNRPSFVDAGPVDLARTLYERAIEISKRLGVSTASGQFQSDMKVHLINDGPVTFWLESEPLKSVESTQ